MWRSIISPVQAWLVSQGRCVGCGRNIPKAEQSGGVKVVCQCGRIYIHDVDSGKFRRATIDEIK